MTSIHFLSIISCVAAITFSNSYACSLDLSGLPNSSPFHMEVFISDSVHEPELLKDDLAEISRFITKSVPVAVHNIKKLNGHEPIYFVASWEKPDQNFEGRAYLKEMTNGKSGFVDDTFPTDIKTHYIKSSTVMLSTGFGGITHLTPNCTVVIPGEEGYPDADKYPQMLYEQYDQIEKLSITLISDSYSIWEESRVDKMVFEEEMDSKFGKWTLFTDVYSYSIYIQNSSDEIKSSQNLNLEIIYGIVAAIGISAGGIIFAVIQKRK